MTATDCRQRIVRAAGELFIVRGYLGRLHGGRPGGGGQLEGDALRYFAGKSALSRAAVEALCDEWSQPLHDFAPGGEHLADNLVALASTSPP